jgi:lysophospholipase L1-like esterase
MRKSILTVAFLLAACAHPAPEPVAAVTPSPAPINLVAIGASDLVGVGAAHPEKEGWAPVLATLLPGVTHLTKLGVSGATAGRLKDQVPAAVAAKPDAVVLWTGVNDFNAQVPLTQFQSNLDGILTPLAGTGAKLYVVNLPDIDRLPAFKVMASGIRAVLPAWQQAVRTTGARHGAKVVELAPYSNELSTHPDYISGDGFHPSAIGYRRIAEIVAESMERAPATSSK